jgi:hypothetical protein
MGRPTASHEKRITFTKHLPEERGILYHFLSVLAFPDTHLHSQVSVHLSKKGNNIGKAESPLRLTYFQ